MWIVFAIAYLGYYGGKYHLVKGLQKQKLK